jgi:hypothetical protein
MASVLKRITKESKTSEKQTKFLHREVRFGVVYTKGSNYVDEIYCNCEIDLCDLFDKAGQLVQKRFYSAR